MQKKQVSTFIPKRRGFGRRFKIFSKVLLAIASVFFGACSIFSGNTEFDRFSASASWVEGDAAVRSAQNVFVEQELTFGQLEQEASALGLEFLWVLDRSDNLGSADSSVAGTACREQATLEDRLACLEDPTVWNRGPEFPYWASDTTSVAVLKGISISTGSMMLETGVESEVPCLLNASLQNAPAPPANVIQDRNDEVTTIPRKDARSLCESLPGSVFAYPQWLTQTSLSELRGAGLFVSDGDRFFAKDETSAIQQYIEAVSRNQTIPLLAGSFAQVTSVSNRAGAWNRVGDLRSSVWAKSKEPEALVASIVAGRTVIHGSEAFVEARVYNEVGEFLIDESTGELGASNGARVEASSRERYIRVQGKVPSGSAGWVYGYRQASTGPVLEQRHRLEPICKAKCFIDFTLLHQDDEAFVFVFLVAPVDMLGEVTQPLKWKEFALASPIYFQ
jgi:hypothetical protein